MKIKLISPKLDSNKDEFYDILQIFKSLIKIFEDPKTPFFKGFVYLEPAKVNFTELIDRGNRFAGLFIESFLNYTLRSSDGGIWIFAYLLTQQGQKDFHERQMNKNYDKIVEPIKIRQMNISNPKDELEITADDLAEESIASNPENIEHNSELISDSISDSVSDSDIESDSEPISESDTKSDIQSVSDNQEKYGKRTPKQFVVKEIDSDIVKHCSHPPKIIYKFTDFHTYIQSAKIWLAQHLINISYSKRSADTIIKYFNTYIKP